MTCFVPAAEHMIESPKEVIFAHSERQASPCLLPLVATYSIHVDGHRWVEAARSLSVRSGEKAC